MKTLNINLPSFGGFYESQWYNSDLEYNALHDLVEGYDQLEHADDWGVSQDFFEDVSRNYVEYMGEFFKDLGLKVKLIYETITSPREYNFTTDRIWAYMNWDDDYDLKGALLELMEKHKDKLTDFIYKYHTSYDGFFSTMYNDYETWHDIIAEMDENVDERYVSCLLAYLVLCDQDYEGLRDLDDAVFDHVVSWCSIDISYYIEPQTDEAREEYEEYQKRLEYKAMLERDQLTINFPNDYGNTQLLSTQCR